MKLQLATFLFAVLLSNTTALPSVDHCLTKFEDSLKETILLKKTCDEANLRDCCQIAQTANIINKAPKSGIYDISNVCQHTAPFTQDIFPSMQARCNMDSGDGGWTVLVRRTPDVAKREHFNRTWEEYENGFGNLTGEFWYGLKNMHCLTSREPMEVEVEVSKTDGTKLLLEYGEFKVDGPSTSYTLHVSGKQHEGYDYLTHHNGLKFSTLDKENDIHSTDNCALKYGGSGGWFGYCYTVHITAMPQPVLWKPSTNTYYDYAELRVRPKSCSLTAPSKCTE